MYVRTMLDLKAVTDLDGEAVCVAVEAAHARMIAAEVEQFTLAAHWADLHAGEALEDERRRSGRRVLPGMERARQLGAHGTPSVAEFAAMELGAPLGMGHVAAGCYLRDALNVRHRHPLLWAALQAGTARVWQARAVSKMCATAGLDLDQARWVDAVTTPYAGSLPWGRFETLVEAKIVEADPEAAEERRTAAAMARFVRTGQSSEFGLKTLVARAAAGDVIFFVAMVDRIAQILAERGDTEPVDVRRSKAIGILATPARALQMLQEAAVAADTEPDTDPDTEHPDDADGPAPRTPGAWPWGPPVKLDPRRLLPSATLYLHLSQSSMDDRAGVARMEGVGPITVEQVREFLGHCNVRVVPVLDVAGQVPIDAYEVPDRMAEAVRLRSPACVSPWGSNLSRLRDLDHVVPYVPPQRGGPPAQTAMDNLAPLSRFSHRVKTHGRWRLRQPEPGVFEWLSPHGYRFRVDHTGTLALGRKV